MAYILILTIIVGYLCFSEMIDRAYHTNFKLFDVYQSSFAYDR
jgi:hypothetical protein